MDAEEGNGKTFLLEGERGALMSKIYLFQGERLHAEC